MTIVLKPADIDFSKATAVISDAMKFVLPVPDDEGEPLIYPQTITDAKGAVHQAGEPLTTWDGKPLPGDGVVVWNSSEKIYQGAVRGRQGDDRAVIIINHVTEEKAARLMEKLNAATAGQPDALTFTRLKEIERFARSLGLTNMYDSMVGFVRQAMQDVRPGADASPYGFKKRDARDRAFAVRVPIAGELVRPEGQPLPFAAGSIILKHGDDVRVLTARDIEATYRHAENFSALDASAIHPLTAAGGQAITSDSNTASRPGVVRRLLRGLGLSKA